MHTGFPTLSGPVDCPACGVSVESGFAFATQGEYGTDLACEACGFTLWQSTVVDRGSEITPDQVISLAARKMPDLPAGLSYREPWDRRSGLALWWVSDPTDTNDPTVASADRPTAWADRAISSVTVRFVRSKRPSDAVR
jgi:hypothetical protein